MTPEERLMACDIGNVRVPEPFDKRDRREWRKDPCDPRYVSIEKIYYANGNSLNCKGCGALVEAGDGTCPYCDRRYRK